MKVIKIFLLMSLLVSSGPLSIYAQPIKVAVKLGIEGVYKEDRWAPLTVSIEGPMSSAGKVLVSLGVRGCGGRCDKVLRTFSAALEIGDSTITLPIRLSSAANILKVSIIGNERLLYSETIKISPIRDCLVVSLTSEQARFNVLLPNIKMVFPEPSSLPKEWCLYDAVDSIILDDIYLDNIDPLVFEAIFAWLSSGGRMILTPDCLRLNSESPRLLSLIELEVQREIRVSGPKALSTYFGMGPDSIKETTILNLDIAKENVVLSWQGHPLLIKKEFGLGDILLTTFKIDRFKDPKEHYQFLRRLWERLLTRDYRGDRLHWEKGYTTPKEAEVEYLYKYIFLYLFVFLIVLGPLNYIVLKRFDRREYILLTIPIVVLIFGISAYLIGRGLRGTMPVMKIVSVEFGRVGDRIVTSRTYLGLLSPDTKPHTIEIKDKRAYPIDSIELEFWQESKLVGRYPLEFSISKEGTTISNLYLPKWAMRFFRLDSFKVYDQTVEAQIRLEGEKLVGRVTNFLPFTLKDAYIVYRYNHVKLGDLLPGESKDWEISISHPKEVICKISPEGCRLDCSEHQNIFAKGLWKDEAYGDTILEALQDVMSNFTYQFEEPVLVGLIHPFSSEIGLKRNNYSKDEIGLSLYKIPLYLGDDKLDIPFGLARRMVFIREERPGSPFGVMLWGDEPVEFHYDLPININEPIVVEELSLYLRRNFGREEFRVPLVVSAFNWQEGTWNEICKTDKETELISIQDPQKYVLFPEVKVKLKVSLAESMPPFNMNFIRGVLKGEFYFGHTLIEYLDVSFKGKRI